MEERQWNLAQVMMEAVVKTTIGWMGIFSHILYITVHPLPYHKFHFSPLERSRGLIYPRAKTTPRQPKSMAHGGMDLVIRKVASSKKKTCLFHKATAQHTIIRLEYHC
jgi:hypothetical protein